MRKSHPYFGRESRRRPRRDPMRFAFAGVATLALLGGAAFIGGTAYYETGTHETQTCAVESKDRTTTTDGGSDARVYTDCGVFQVKDSLWNGQWASADTFGAISEGQTYEFTTYGVRIPFLSLFPVIIDAETVTT